MKLFPEIFNSSIALFCSFCLLIQSDPLVVKRQFFHYSADGAPIEIIEDDGDGEDENDFKNVTDRRVITLLPYIDPNGLEPFSPAVENFPQWEENSLSLGDSLLFLTGYYEEETGRGVAGKGEVNDKVRICYTNGIQNKKEECVQAAHFLAATHGHTNVHYFYHGTLGLAGDILRGQLITWFGWTSPEAYRIAEMWHELITEMGGTESGGVILHYAHSLGAAETKAAGELMTAKERAMIHVVAFGSPTVFPEGKFSNAIHYISHRDGAVLGDLVRYLQEGAREGGSVVFINDFLGGIPFVDHNLLVTYRYVLIALGLRFVEIYGSVSQ